jgi:uncharacterized membrane protein YagU involved in acid resistance
MHKRTWHLAELPLSGTGCIIVLGGIVVTAVVYAVVSAMFDSVLLGQLAGAGAGLVASWVVYKKHKNLVYKKHNKLYDR